MRQITPAATAVTLLGLATILVAGFAHVCQKTRPDA
jgi:hypothetical protein